MLFGKTISQSQEAAKGLYEETEALKSVGGAAEDAAGSLAGFDEINTIQTENAGGSGGGASSIAPDFNLDGMLDESQLQKVLELIKLIGSALAAWKLSSALGLGLKGFLGLLLAIYSAINLAENVFDAWTNGVTWDNFLGMLTSALGLSAGLGLAFGKVGAGIGLVVSGLTMLVTGFHDAFENGWNLENLLTSISGIILTGLGISILTGSWIPMLIAGIAAVLLAFTVATGHGEELLDGIKTMMEGFVDFFTGIFSGDIEKAIGGIEKIFEGLKTAVFAVVDGLRDTLLGFLDWLDEKTGGKLHGIIESVKSWVTNTFARIKEEIAIVIDAVKEIFKGLTEFIAGVFTGDWDRAWEGVKTIFKGIWNGIISILELTVNRIIQGINWLISQINKLSFNIPDWVPDWVTEWLGVGKTVGINIPTIKELSIPRLAAGAVVPPNREFMAVLGDQHHGNNLEAPEDLIRQIVREEAGSLNTDLLQAILEAIRAGHIIKVNEDVLGRTTVKTINNFTRQSGKPVLLL